MLKSLLFIITYSFAVISFASGVETGASGYSAGFWHPILGFDHLLAMVAVGLLSVQLGRNAIWFVPAAFVIVMAIGGYLGYLGIPLPEVEGVIALSVLLIGFAIAVEQSMPVIIAMIFVGFFAIFHGYAHGAEMPNLTNPSQYIIGFMGATAIIHIIGVLIGEACRLFKQPTRARALIGAGIAGIGLHMVMLTYGLV